jgi:hypothetical protein
MKSSDQWDHGSAVVSSFWKAKFPVLLNGAGVILSGAVEP